MPSTFTANLGLEKPALTEASGLWGEKLNVNLQSIDRAINGGIVIDLTGLTTYTLTTTDAALSDGNYKLLQFVGSPSAAVTVTISPNDQDKWFYVLNDTAQQVTITQGSGGNAVTPASAASIIYADGAGASATCVNVASILSLGASASITGGTITGVTLTTADATITGGSITGITLTASSATITGGTITGITDLAIDDGGTGSSDAAAARTALDIEPGTDILAYDANLQGFVDTFTLPTVDGAASNLIRTNGSGALSFTGQDVWRPTATGAVTAGDVVALNNDGTVSVVTTLAANADDWAGIAFENIADGATGHIQTRGRVDTNQSGLTARSIYYVDTDGSLTTSSAGGRKIGKALSATRLLITEGNV